MNRETGEERDGRLVAFEAVVAAYEGQLLRYATRIVDDRDGAQDVVQETFIRLYRNWADEMAPSPQLTTWLYRVAHNCAVDLVRRKARRESLHNRHAEEQEAIVVPPVVGGALPVSEDGERASAALRALSLRERDLVILKVYEEKSYREISEITGLTVTNVGFILHTAMKKLAAEMRRTAPK